MNDKILLIDKPAGMSSFGVVARVRRKLSEQAGFVMVKGKDGVERQKRKKVKVGHTGTLDPFATGLLIILTGKETKRANEFLKLDKEYIATIRLGAISTTGDIEGEIRYFVACEGRHCRDTVSLSESSPAGRDSDPAQPDSQYLGQLTTPSTRQQTPTLSILRDSSGQMEVESGGLLSRCISTSPMRKPESSKSQREGSRNFCDGKAGDSGFRIGREETATRSNPPDLELNCHPTLADVKEVVQSFVGEIEQTVPAYSAVKINGQRAYKLAREGKEVEMPRRKVQIYEIEILHYEWPELEIRCKVSSGTYIRTLGEDIGKALGVGGYLTALRRTQVGKYRVKDAMTLEGFLAD